MAHIDRAYVAKVKPEQQATGVAAFCNIVHETWAIGHG